MDTTVEFKMDFHSDWTAMLKSALQELGYVVDPNLDPSNISITYFNLQRRRISASPRKLFVSREFTCPTNLDTGLDLIKNKIKIGDDLFPHQSTRLNDPNYNDPLLNDWDIHHLHLGTVVQTSGFVERTGPVLFARITEDSFYMIDVLDHGSGLQPWVKRRLIEIIHSNWPESIAQYRIKGILSVEFNPSDEEIGKLRKSNLNSTLQMDDGTIYAPPGGGFTTSGSSVEAVLTTNKYTHLIRNIEKFIRDNVDNLILDAAKAGVTIGPRLDFKMIELRNESVTIVDTNTGFAFRFPIQN